MKSTIDNTCKTLTKIAIAASLSISLLSASAFAQEAPAKPSPDRDIQLQKVDGPRKTGRKRAATSDQQPNNAENQLHLQRGEGVTDSANSKAAPTIRRLDPDKVKELRTRIRTERSSRIRDRRFQEERTKNIRHLVQIERVRQLAEQSNDQALLERANLLRDKEIQRHTRKLAKLRIDDAKQRKNNIRQHIEKTDSQQAQ